MTIEITDMDKAGNRKIRFTFASPDEEALRKFWNDFERAGLRRDLRKDKAA